MLGLNQFTWDKLATDNLMRLTKVADPLIESCNAFGQWPDALKSCNHVKQCSHLVKTSAYASCDDYCASMPGNHTCFYAAEEWQNDCMVLREESCETNIRQEYGQEYGGTSDMWCGCTSGKQTAIEAGNLSIVPDKAFPEADPVHTVTRGMRWSELSRKERAAAAALGYNQTTWDNNSGSEPQPASASKHWSQLTTCGKRSSVHGAVCKLKCCALLGASYHTAL